MFRRKNIPFFYDQKSKKDAVLALLNRYSLKPDEAMYIGSTYSDLECMQLIPFAVCPEDAIPPVINVCITTLSVFGGMGVFCHVCYLLEKEIIRRKRMTSNK
jgi:3-deoxy-D-manno-octulosonate 8-phosphate phosphatase KdsC-like HAD superfamily phosphatase